MRSTPVAAPASPAEPSRQGLWVKRLGTHGLIVVQALLILIFSLVAPRFASLDNLLNVLRQVVTLGLLACGLAVLVVSRNIDLSVGATMALVSVTLARVSIATGSILAGLLATVAVAAAVGVVNALIVTRWRLQAFIVTLGTWSVVQGCALLLSGGNPVSGLPASFGYWGGENLFGIPTAVYFLVVVVVGSHLLLHHTAFGKRCFAQGGNPTAAIASGISPWRTNLQAYVYASMVAGLTGVLATSRAMVGHPRLGSEVTLPAVAAVIIGGGSLAGGRGSIPGALLGVAVVSTISNGLNLVGVSSYIQEVVTGTMILVAAWADRRRT